MLHPLDSAVRHVYVHIPFCTHICPYCAFYKTRNLTSAMRPFLPALQREVEWSIPRLAIKPETVFFGGGTPSALSLSQIRELDAWWPWHHIPEFTWETNPMTVSAAKIEALQHLGVNRISLGVQAFDVASLQLLGRTHRASDVVTTVQRLRHGGLHNINIDLMFALPGQSMQTWRESVEQALALKPTHMSLYELTYEEDTEFLQKVSLGDLVPSDLGREMHLWAIEFLTEQGFRHYEVSNFARPGFEAAHNLACWRGSDYVGFGPSACSTVGLQRWRTVADITVYAANPLQREWEPLDPSVRRSEQIILGLRTCEGIPRDWLSDRDSLVQDFASQGWLTCECDRVILTSSGMMVADSILDHFLNLP